MPGEQGTTFRIGDVVTHRPTGETWVVSGVDGVELYWAGWPPGSAAVADCEVVRWCDDSEHVEFVRMVRQSTEDQRGTLARLHTCQACRAAGL